MDDQVDDQGVPQNWLAGMPAFSIGAPPPAPTGLFGPALASGFHEALGNLGATAQAVGTALGMQPVTDWGAGFAQRQAAAATAAGNPELEKEGFGSIKGAVYGLTKSLPSLVPAVAAGFAGGPVGAGLTMLPQAVGENVQAAQQAHPNQPLTSEDAAKSLLLGAPEAAAMAFVPGKLGEFLTKGAAGNFGERVIGGGLKLGAYQGILGATQTAVTQQAFTPDMPVADRARQVVDSALGGGIQGAVFGGLLSLRRAQAPAKTGDPSTVSNDDLSTATDAVVQPQQLALPAPNQPAGTLPAPEHMTPLSKVSGQPYGDVANDQLQTMAQPLEAKGSDRSAAENVQYGLIKDEIAQRTPPGGEGAMFTPEEMAARQPGVDAMRALVGGIIGDERPFVQHVNASNEAELVNSIRAEVAKATPRAPVPEYFRDLAEKFGVPVGKEGQTPAEMLVDLQDQLSKSQAARDAAQAAGKTPLMRAANKEITDLVPRIAAAEKLAQLHLDADQIKAGRLPAIEDQIGQLNLPGLGERPVVPTTEGQTVEGGNVVPTTDQLNLGLSPEKMDAMARFQDLALSAFKPAVRARVEPVIRGSGATSEPELINALRDQHQALDGAEPPAALGTLLEHFGVADRLGEFVDLAATRRELMNRYQEKLDAAATLQKAKKAGQADVAFNKAQDYRNTVIKAHDDLAQSHMQAEDLRKPEPDQTVAVPDGVAPEQADRWRLAETMRTNAQDPATVKAVELAQRAIEQGNPHSQAIMQLAQNKFLDEMRAKVTTDRPGAPAPPVEGVPVPLDDRVAAAAAGGDVVSINDLKAKLGDVSDQDLGASLARLEKADRVEGMAHDLPAMARDAGVVKRPNGTDINAVMAREPVKTPVEEKAVQGIVPGTSPELAKVRTRKRVTPKSVELPTDEQTAKIAQLEPNLNPENHRFAKGTPAPKKGGLPKKIEAPRAQEKLEAAVAGGKLGADKLAQAQQVLALPRGEVKNIRMRDLENSWATIEAVTGRPFNASVSSVEPPKLATVDYANQEWAKSAADAVYGDVVAADNRIALVRSFGDLGKAVYLPVDRNLGLRGQEDIRSSKVQWLHGPDRDKLLAAARTAEAYDQKAYEANPDGPFKDATSRVVGSQTADPRIVSYIGNLLHSVGIDARVLVTNTQDVRGSSGDELGLHGPYQAARALGHQDLFGEMTSMGPGLKDFVINIDHSMSDSMKVETAAHEVGHIVYRTALRNAPADVRARIESAYKDFLRRTTGMKTHDIINATRNRETARKVLDGVSPAHKMDQDRKDYFLSKDEWFADGVSRWATTAEKPRNALEKFFSDVAQKIKQLVAAITGNKFIPDAAVHAFMDRLAETSDLQALGSSLRGDRIPTIEDTGPRTVTEADDTARQTVASISSIRDHITERAFEEPKAGAGASLRRATLIAQTLDGIARIGKDFLPAAARWRDMHTNRQLYADAKDKANLISARAYHALKAAVRRLVDEHLAMLNDGAGLDSRKSLADQGVVVTPEIAARHKAMQSHLDAVTRAGGRPALEAILQAYQTIRYQSIAARMYREGQTWIKQGGKPFEGHMLGNPDAVYRTMTGERGHDSPDATNIYYKNVVRAMRDGIAKHIGEQDALAGSKAPGAKAGGLDYLRENLTEWNSEMGQADKGTYVPITRGTGKYFVAGKLAQGDDKAPTPAAVQALQAALDKDFPNIGVFHDSESNTVMSRVESMAQMERLKAVFSDLEKAGHMLPGETRSGYPDKIDTFAGLGPKYLQRMITSMDEMLSHTDVTDEVATQLKKNFVDQWMNMLPDNSVLKNAQPRKNISGFSKDLGEQAIRLMTNQTRASTAIGMQPAWAEAAQAVRDNVQQAKAGPNAVKAQDIANELMLREAQKAWQTPHSPFDTMQMAMHTLRIGFSPPYILTMMSQIPTLSLPELSKKWGYAKSSLALARAAPRSFAALRAMLSDPDWARAGMRETTLRKAGLAEKDIQTLLKLDNMGGGSNSSYTSALTDLGEGADSRMHHFKTMANAMGLYSEMFPRIITALAAGDLHDAQPIKNVSREQAVYDMVNNSQFNWGAGQSSRLTGNKGPLGAASRVVFQFTSFQTRMLEKLFTETKGLFDKDPQLRKESVNFLAGHLVAMTAIAGTLGLPAVGMIAGLADKLISAWTGKDDVDTQGIYRTYLAGMFGPAMADVMAKGLPRGLGLDFSHLGEQNIIPFTSLIANKRKFEDAQKDFFKGAAGSAFGELGNMYLGARDMVNGDYLRGAIKVLPEGFKGLAEGINFYKNGYVDKNGVKYPVQPGAMDILAASLGLDPANLAQYDEAARIRSGLMAQRQYRSQNITTHLLRSINNPASGDLQGWIKEAIQYQLDHPGESSPLARLQQTLMGATRRSAIATALHTPLGVQPQDTGLIRNLGFVTPQQ